MTSPARFRRNDWSAADVEKWNARLDQILAARGLTPTDLPEVDWDAEEQRVRDEWAAEKSRALLTRLPDRYRNAIPRHQESLRWLRDYAEGDMVNLAILGPGGVGKTWELAAIVRLLLTDERRRVPATMITVAEMLKALRPNADGASDIGQFQCAPVLGLDDLGLEKQSEWTEEQLFMVADYRHNRNLPTIITSNLPPAALEQRYGPRLCRRLFEGARLLEIRTAPPEVPPRFGRTD